jgi:TBC1 domain family member 14
MDKLKDTDKVRDMVIYNVPAKLRGEIWKTISGNPASISQDYYQLLVEKGKRIGDVIMKKASIEKSGQPEHDSEYLRTKIEYNMMAMKPGVSHEESIVIVENDLPRTFTTLRQFNQETQEGKDTIEKLRRILRAFTVMRPDVGYVQGMSYLAGFILMETSEYDTFVLFHNLIIKSQILSFYKFKADDIIQRLKFFRQAFLVEIPDLCEYFEEEKIDPRSYVYEWVMTLYTRALPMDVAVRVWDLYFIDGFPLLFKTALAILKIVKDKILYSDISEVMNTLKNTQSLILDDSMLLKAIDGVNLPEWVYEELKDI